MNMVIFVLVFNINTYLNHLDIYTSLTLNIVIIHPKQLP